MPSEENTSLPVELVVVPVLPALAKRPYQALCWLIADTTPILVRLLFVAEVNVALNRQVLNQAIKRDGPSVVDAVNVGFAAFAVSSFCSASKGVPVAMQPLKAKTRSVAEKAVFVLVQLGLSKASPVARRHPHIATEPLLDKVSCVVLVIPDGIVWGCPLGSDHH